MAKRKIKEVVEMNEVIETVAEVGATKEKVEPIKLSDMQQLTYDLLKTKSAKIRFLSGESFSRSQIANFVGVRYQHVRNVLTTELKRPIA